MRKLLFATIALLGLTFGVNAQDKSKKMPPPPPPPKEAKAPVKKDGTPDKRFKENKEAKPKVPVKKDGTPDKRFKENKK